MDTEPGGGIGRCYVSALSQHPDSAQAAAEVTAPVLAQLGPMPELAVFFVTPPHRDAVDDIADVVRSVLQPVTLLGAAAVAVLGPRREVEETPGVSLFAARLGSPALPVRLGAERTGQGWQISGFPTDVAGPRSLLLVADPFTFPVDALLDELARTQPGLAIVGGMASAANAPGTTGCSSTTRPTPTGRSGRFSPRTSPRKPSCHRAAGRSGAPTSSPAPTAT